jgi:hypothetical protein
MSRCRFRSRSGYLDRGKSPVDRSLDEPAGRSIQIVVELVEIAGFVEYYFQRRDYLESHSTRLDSIGGSLRRTGRRRGSAKLVGR